MPHTTRRSGRRSGSLAVLGALLAVAADCPAVAAPGWHADVVIDHTAGATALTNHQVAVTLDGAALVAAGRLRPDAADLRFHDASGVPLCHNVESGLATHATLVWVKVPAIPAHATVTIGVGFGDAGATSADDPTCTFPFFDGFDGGRAPFAPLCGDVTAAVDDGVLALSWSGSGLVASDVAFPPGEVHVAEARVLGTTGAWPGLHWTKDASRVSYGIVSDATEVRIGRTAVATGDACFGHDWVTTAHEHAGVEGTWQLLWPATGSVAASVPGVAPLATSDATWARDESLRLVLGGVAAGSGSMLIDWVRTRRFTPTPPVASIQNLRHACADAPTTCDDGDACTVDSCDPASGCGHTALACDDGDACTTESCDPGAGCVTTPVACDDGDACTDDVCDPRTGCGHTPVQGATFHAIDCALDALRASVESPRTDPPPAVAARLLDKASRALARAQSLVDTGRRPQAARRLGQAATTLARLARRLRRLVARGAIDTITPTAWATDAEGLAAAVAALRDGLD